MVLHPNSMAPAEVRCHSGRWIPQDLNGSLEAETPLSRPASDCVDGAANYAKVVTAHRVLLPSPLRPLLTILCRRSDKG